MYQQDQKNERKLINTLNESSVFFERGSMVASFFVPNKVATILRKRNILVANNLLCNVLYLWR
jgi:hypothetical protein